MHRSYGTIHWPYETDLCQKYNQSKDDRSTCSTRHFHTSAYIPSQTIWGNHWINCWVTFRSWFAQDEASIWHNTSNKIQIDTGDSEPVLQRPYPTVMKHYDWVKNEINKHLDAQVICSSHSSWSAPNILVTKGNGGKCLVIDHRALNKVHMEVCVAHAKVWRDFSKLNGAKYFSTLNLWAWYHHIPLDEDSILKTAFTSPFGKYEYLKVPFGLAQSSSILWRTQE